MSIISHFRAHESRQRKHYDSTLVVPPFVYRRVERSRDSKNEKANGGQAPHHKTQLSTTGCAVTVLQRTVLSSTTTVLL